MKITGIKYEIVWLRESSPIKIAFTEIDEVPTIIVKITTDEGISGFGEACPFPAVTGENEVTVMNALKMIEPGLIGEDPFNIHGIHEMMDRCIFGNTSAKCGIDLALYDIMAKAANQPLYKFLGTANNKVVTDVTIGIDRPERMLKKAKEWVDKGFRILKIKTGINPEEDIEAIRLMRNAFGKDVLIRIDGNQGYSVSSCMELIPKLVELDVKAIEQPLPYWDLDGMARLRANSGQIQIMADESLHSPQDALRICRKGAADILNIKLMKCGGLYPAMKINTIAEGFGINCMVGCMFDTKVAISAALAFVAANRNVTEADCDGFLLLKDQGVSMQGGFTYKGSDITLSDSVGIGLDIDF